MKLPLRENLALFFEGTFGGSTEQADIAHVIHQRNATIRKMCLGRIAALLEALVLDPAMMMQIGMDEHFKVRVSDRPAKLVLDHWTVGPGGYTDDDVENLSRALTGWQLTAAGRARTEPPDPAAARPARRIGNVTIGSFETPTAVSFDTHIDQLAKHQVLFTELGQGLRAFASHLRRTGQLDRVLAITFSDFGRQLGENRTQGTDHGDASVMFVMGGRIRPGLLGVPLDPGRVHDGGLEARVDFRRVYADVLGNWLRVDTAAMRVDERHTAGELASTPRRPLTREL